jgi:hypothetical protein
MRDGLWRSRCSRIVGHGGVRVPLSGRACGRRWSSGWPRVRLRGADARATARVRYGSVLQPRNDGTQCVVLVLGMRRRCLGVPQDVQLVWLQYSLQRVQEETRIFWCPQVDIDGMQPVHVFALVHRVGRGEVPLRGDLVGTGRPTVIRVAEAVDGQGEEARVLVRVLDADCVQLWYHWVSSSLPVAGTWLLTTREGILLRRPGVVRDFDAPALLDGVVVEVDIGALVEAVVRRLVSRRGEIVVDVCKAAWVSVRAFPGAWRRPTASTKTLRPAAEALC